MAKNSKPRWGINKRTAETPMITKETLPLEKIPKTVDCLLGLAAKRSITQNFIEEIKLLIKLMPTNKRAIAERRLALIIKKQQEMDE